MLLHTPAENMCRFVKKLNTIITNCYIYSRQQLYFPLHGTGTILLRYVRANRILFSVCTHMHKNRLAIPSGKEHMGKDAVITTNHR